VDEKEQDDAIDSVYEVVSVIKGLTEIMYLTHENLTFEDVQCYQKRINHELNNLSNWVLWRDKVVNSNKSEKM
jgi:hypothetical protein